MPVIRSHSFRGVDSPHRDPLSPALSRQKSVPTTPTRRLKQNAENLPPNTAPALLKADGFSSPSFSKPPIPKSSVKANGSLNSPGLPPRPPSAKPSPSANRVHGNQETSGNARRKLSWDVQNNSNVLQEHISAVCSKVSENNTSDTGVQVMVRIRPLNKKEQNEEAERIIIKTSPNTFCMSDQHYTFDAVAGEDASQEQIFQTMGMPMVENCLQGFNSSIFAYGQTGSGKTYTMWGTIDDPSNGSAPKEQRGLTPRVFEKLFERTKQEEKKHCTKQLRYQCRCSFLEIYNEQIMDLLQPSLKNLQIREDTKTGVYVDNLTEEYVSNTEDVSRLLLKGMSNRRVGSTSMNTESSRSHCVFTCILECRYKSMADGMSSIRSSRINLVDLAGSERQKQTAAAGERLKEAGSINRSLSQLGNLINILAEVAQTGKQRHIPYRDSRLTFLLQESLGGNAKLAMICAVSPANSCKNETQSTLRFAQRAKAIRNKAVINEETTTDANLLREQIRQLKEELMRMKSKEIQQTGTVGAYSNAWNARRSYNLLRFSLNHSVAPPTADSDTEEDMEIDDDDVDAAQSSSNKSVGVKKSIEEHSESPSSSCLRLDEDLRGASNAEFKKQELITVVHPNIGSILEFAMESDGNDQIQDSVMVKEGVGGHLESLSSPCTRFGKDLVKTTNAELKERELLRVVHSNLEPILECAMEADGNAQIQDSVVVKGVEGHVRSPSRPYIRIDGDLGEAITQEPNEKELATVVHSNLEPILEGAIETDKNAQSQDSIMVKEGAEGHLETPSCPCIGVDEDLVGRTNAELYKKELVKMVHSILDPILECAMETVVNRQIEVIGVEGDIESSSSPSARIDKDFGETTNVEHKEKRLVTVMHSTLETDGNAQMQDSVVVKEGHLEYLPEEKGLILEPIVECAMEPTGDAQIQESNMAQDIIGEVQIVEAEKRTECGPSADLKLEPALETDDIQDLAMLNEGIEGTLEFSSDEKDLTLGPIVECAKETVENAQIRDFAMVNERVEEHLESASKEKDSISEPILECAKETVEDAQIQAIVEVEENKESSSPAKSHPECAKEIDAEIEEAELPCGKSGDICKDELDDDSRDEQLQMENGVEGKTQGKTNEQIQDSKMVLEAQEAGLSAESHPEYLKEIHAEVEADCGFSRDTCENAMDELVSDDSRDEQQLRDTEFVKMEDKAGKTEGKRKRDNDELSEWAEREEEWVALFEELRAEAKAYKRQAIRRQRELEKERQHSEEMKEALYVAMDGHARLLEQYAELQEKHVGLLAKHRKIRDGVADVKRMASKAGVRASHSKWLETQAAQIVALNLEREQERQAANEEIEDLRAQLRDTAEAVQAAGELLVRLKEAEEAVTFSQDTAALAEQEADAMRREIEKMKRRHATEIATLQQRLLEARLKKASACPMCVMAERVKFEFTEVDAETAQADLEAEEDAAAISAAPPDASNTVMWGMEHQQFYECQPLEDEGMQEWYMENDTCNLDCEGSFYE